MDNQQKQFNEELASFLRMVVEHEHYNTVVEVVGGKIFTYGSVSEVNHLTELSTSIRESTGFEETPQTIWQRG